MKMILPLSYRRPTEKLRSEYCVCLDAEQDRDEEKEEGRCDIIEGKLSPRSG
jgi:hypothetical protein